MADRGAGGFARQCGQAVAAGDISAYRAGMAGRDIAGNAGLAVLAGENGSAACIATARAARSAGGADRPVMGNVATGVAMDAVAARAASCAAAQPDTDRIARCASGRTAGRASSAVAGLAGKNAGTGSTRSGLVLAAEQRRAICGCATADERRVIVKTTGQG